MSTPRVKTDLVFDQHKAFFPNPDDLIQYIQKHRHQVIEKKVLVEVATLGEALRFAEVGVDGLQFDKVTPQDLSVWLPKIRNAGYLGIIIATGGITAVNVADYAATGVNGIATSWVYHGPGMDIGTRIEAR